MDGIPGIMQGLPVQTQIPISREMVIHKCAIQVMPHPNGSGKILRFVCPDGLAIGIPMDETAIEAVVQGLKGTGLQVAKGASLPGL